MSVTAFSDFHSSSLPFQLGDAGYSNKGLIVWMACIYAKSLESQLCPIRVTQLESFVPGLSPQTAESKRKEERKKKEKRKKLLAKQGSFKGGQSSNYLDKTGGTSLGKLIKMAFSLSSWLPLEMKAHFLFGLFRFFK